MQVEQPVLGVYMIGVPTPYPVGPMNCYVLDGPRPALVDCGPPTPDAERALRAGLRTIGIAPSDLATIVLTHHHQDHVGGLSWLVGETNAPLAGHRFNDVWLAGDHALAEARVAFYVDLYRYCGAHSDLADEIRRRFVAEEAVSSRRVDLPLAEGDEIEIGAHTWTVHETPGHAGSSVSLLRADGVALVGDTLLARISSNALFEPPYPGQTGRVSSLLAYRQSLRLLADLPLTTVLPGHGPAFSGHTALIERRLVGQEERARRLLDGLDAEHETVAALSQLLFPSLAGDQQFLGLSEVLGHLDLLEEQDRAEHTGVAPARYRRR